jgi:hypothetical protein
MLYAILDGAARCRSRRAGTSMSRPLIPSCVAIVLPNLLRTAAFSTADISF